MPGEASSRKQKARRKRMCTDCGEKYAQELGRCRRCWTKRIGDKTPINDFTSKRPTGDSR